MPITKTNNLGIMYLAQNQNNKEILINEGLLKLDSVLNCGAVSRTTTTPPSSPTEGVLYIIPSGATGAWGGNTNKFTYYSSSKGWVIITPNEGATFWVNDENILYSYDGSTWVKSGLLDTLNKLGINATADATNKLAVKSDAVLFDNNGANSQVKVNKAAASNTASHLFQTNYSGRAEFGLTGDDDFHVKVSADGSAWNEAIKIDKTTGKTTFLTEANFSANGVVMPSGTFTPVLKGLTTAGTPTYTRQVGKYTRMGDVVHVFIDIAISAVGGMAGDLLIDGLPFTSNASPTAYPAIIGNAFSYTLSSAGQSLCAHLLSNNTRMRLTKASITGYSNLQATEISSSFNFVTQLTYKV